MQRISTIQTRATLLRDAIALMESEYGDELTLDDVARREFAKAFTRIHGVPPTRYRTDRHRAAAA